jgi:methylglutaconyl-CoA hydratase
LIRLEQHGPVVAAVLSRPDRRNALTPEMLDRLKALCGSLPTGSRSLVLAGEGPVFCSGFDLALCQAHPDGSAMRALLTGLYEAISTLRDLPIPVVAAVQGAAIAGGCALLGGADFVISHPQARFGYPVVAIGVSPAVSAPFLRNAIGDGAMRELLLDPTLITGAEAHRLGLVYECVASADAVLPRALALAAELAAKPPGAIRATRGWLREIEAALLPIPAERGLDVSRSLTGGTEEQDRLSKLAPRG